MLQKEKLYKYKNNLFIYKYNIFFIIIFFSDKNIIINIIIFVKLY